MSKNHLTALKSLAITTLLLFGAPKINLKIGPVPFYLIDFFILVTFIYSTKLPGRSRFKIPYRSLVNFILVMIVSNEIFNGIILQSVLQPIYLIFRMTLAVSLYYSISRIVTKPSDLMYLLKYGLFGAFISSILLITSSLPMTRGVSEMILSNTVLTPNADRLSDLLLEQNNSGIRGTSLIGVSILSGAFLNVIWPLLFLMLNFKKPKGALKILFYSTLVLAPIGIIMTYSRGAILALLLISFSMTILQKGKYRRVLSSVLLILFMGFSAVGWNSELFMFDRVQNRTIATFKNPYDDARESERINAYIEPFQHIANNPEYLLIGEGFARNKIALKKTQKRRNNRADHAVFAKAYYAYGMITSLAIIALFLLLTRYTYKRISISSSNNIFSYKLSRLSLVLLIGFSSWFSFGHAAVSQPRGAMLMFFVFGLITIQNRMNRNPNKKI